MTTPVVRERSTTRALPTALMCAGCGWRAPGRELHLRCPQAQPGDDIDHVIRRTLDPASIDWPSGGEDNPFIRYRTLFHWYHVARAGGWTDAAIVAEIDRLDERVATVSGRGFRITAFAFSRGLGAWVKNETVNVSGSHKSRHLFGTLLALRFMGEDETRPLAIASCGNAALAAAVIARAAERELHVFVPAQAEVGVIADLEELGAVVSICERGRREKGDPSVLRMRDDVARGAIPFTCQGNENGVAVEGGLTLGYEMVDTLKAQGVGLDNLVVQVGGGALASSLFQAFGEARAFGLVSALPRLFTVQTVGVAPLARAFRVLRERLDEGRTTIDLLRNAASSRSRYMQPWSPVAMSVATGILDDETYDWLEVVRGMLATGGRTVLVDEPDLIAANRIAREMTSIDVDATGSAGLAGLISLRGSEEVSATQASAVLFTGVRRN